MTCGPLSAKSSAYQDPQQISPQHTKVMLDFYHNQKGNNF